VKWSHIGVQTKHAAVALELFKAAGFEPDRVRTLESEVKYSFKDVPDERRFALASATPVHFYSTYAVVGDGPVVSH